jgi:cobalt/nickel transport system ATP-binding protein
MEKIVDIKNLNYRYPDGTCALESIDLEILKGDSVAVVGPNGAGKTTLLLHLNGILNGSDSVRISGMPVNEENLSSIRQKVGLVFQDPDDQLFMPTVFDDVAFGPVNMALKSDEVRERVENALELVNMKDYKEKISHHLSYGEKKRISLATVLSMDPEILALDEPTGNLDPKYRKEFIKFLGELSITKIIATHDIGMVLAICNKTAIVDGGRLVAFDTTEKIFNNKELLRSHNLEGF